MADRAMRYQRRFQADPAPATPRPPPPPIAPPRTFRGPAEPAAAPRKPLSMAEIAERQRAARLAAREPADRAPAPAPASAPANMQERALRFRPSPTDAEVATPDAPADETPKPHRPVAADSAQRAMDATRHKRGDAEPAGNPAPPTEAFAPPPTRSVTVALAARNHAAVIGPTLQNWRAAVNDVDVRFCVVDLGSTDETVAQVQDVAGLALLHCPGGLADPPRVLAVLARGIDADMVVVADGDCQPAAELLALVQACRDAHRRDHWAIGGQGRAAAIALKPLRLRPRTPGQTLPQWAEAASMTAPPRLPRPSAANRSLVAHLFAEPPHPADDLAAVAPRWIRPAVRALLARIL